jgi:hypothetical protein
MGSEPEPTAYQVRDGRSAAHLLHEQNRGTVNSLPSTSASAGLRSTRVVLSLCAERTRCVRVVLDDYATHKRAQVQVWLVKHPGGR